jgi:hypothetical protein
MSKRSFNKVQNVLGKSPREAEVAPYSENAFHQGLAVHKSQPQNILKVKIPPLSN